MNLSSFGKEFSANSPAYKVNLEYRLESIMLKYCIIIVLWNYSMLLLLLSLFEFEMFSQLWSEHNSKTCMGIIPQTGVHLSLLFIITTDTNGVNVAVLMLVSVCLAFLSSVCWLCLIYLLPHDDLHMCLDIIPAYCSNAFGLQLFSCYAQHNRLKPNLEWVDEGHFVHSSANMFLLLCGFPNSSGQLNQLSQCANCSH